MRENGMRGTDMWKRMWKLPLLGAVSLLMLTGWTGAKETWAEEARAEEGRGQEAVVTEMPAVPSELALETAEEKGRNMASYGGADYLTYAQRRNARVLTPGTTVQATFSGAAQKQVIYKYTTGLPGRVHIWSTSDGSIDPDIHFFDSYGYEDDVDGYYDVDEDNYNFDVYADVDRNTTYYFEVYNYRENSGSAYIHFDFTHSHSFSAWSVRNRATVFSAGTNVRTCSTCGKVETVATAKLAPALALSESQVTLGTKQKWDRVTASMAYGDSILSAVSSKPKVVKVTVRGNALRLKAGKKKGSATITVKTAAGALAKLKVKVKKGKVTATKIATNAGKLTLTAGQQFTLTASVSPNTVTSKVTFKSSNKKVASVSKKGVIKAKKKGKATITIKCGKKTKKVKVTVNPGRRTTKEIKKLLIKKFKKLANTSRGKKVMRRTVTGGGLVACWYEGNQNYTVSFTAKYSEGAVGGMVRVNPNTGECYIYPSYFPDEEEEEEGASMIEFDMTDLGISRYFRLW